MLLKLENETAKLHLETQSDLPFEQIFKAYQIVTGDTSTLDVENSESSESLVDDVHKTQTDQSSEKSPRESKSISNFGDTVNVDIMCPTCGFSGIKKTTVGFKYCKCPECKTKIFMRAANGEWGVLDKRGCYYHAYDFYNDPSEDNFYHDTFNNEEPADK